MKSVTELKTFEYGWLLLQLFEMGSSVIYCCGIINLRMRLSECNVGRVMLSFGASSTGSNERWIVVVIVNLLEILDYSAPGGLSTSSKGTPL